MQEVYFTPTPRVLRGLDEIAEYMRVSTRTVRRWIESASFPAIQGPSNVYQTTTSLIDLWFISAWSVERRGIRDKLSDNNDDEKENE